MKKIIAASLVALVLVGCGDPVPQQEWVRGQTDMKMVKGLEDCKYFQVRYHTGANSIHVIRCPLSTTAAQWSVQQGKTTNHYSSVTIDEAAVLDLERKVAAADAERAELAKQLEAAKAGKQ